MCMLRPHQWDTTSSSHFSCDSTGSHDSVASLTPCGEQQTKLLDQQSDCLRLHTRLDMLVLARTAAEAAGVGWGQPGRDVWSG